MDDLSNNNFNIAQETEVKEKKKTGINRYLILACIGLVALIAVLLSIFFHPGVSVATKYSTEDECNFNNGGLLAYSGGKLYSVGNSFTEEKGIFVLSQDGSNPKKISSNEEIDMIRVIDGKIFYSAEKEGEPSTYWIGSMDLNGENEQTIVRSDRAFTDFDVEDNILYYVTDDSLCSISLEDGQQKTLVAGNDDIDVKEFVVRESNLFYSTWGITTNSGLFKYDLDSGSSTKISDSSTNNLVFWEEDLVFAGYQGIERMSLVDNTTQYLVKDDRIANFTISDGTIYYIHKMDDSDRNALGVAIAEKLGYTDSLMQAVIGIMFSSYGSLIEYSLDSGRSNDLSSKLEYSFADQLYLTDNYLHANASFFVGMDVIPVSANK